jgi:hypothetical protein
MSNRKPHTPSRRSRRLPAAIAIAALASAGERPRGWPAAATSAVTRSTPSRPRSPASPSRATR